ncbi:unnamed protein product, partial [Strongylus vulgaris]
QVGFTIAKIEAVDPDGDPIWWSIEGGNVNKTFALKPDICREIRAIIFARQGTLTNYVTLTVTVTDDNDNAPRFVHKDYSVTLPLRSPVGYSVVTLLAHDADSGENGMVKYSIISGEWIEWMAKSAYILTIISFEPKETLVTQIMQILIPIPGNEHGFFSLDPVLGVVRLAKPLPQEHTESILTVRATDGGKYPLSDTANVRIQTDAYDGHGFRFTRELYQRTVRDTTALGTVLLVVSTQPNGVLIKMSNTNQHSPIFKKQVYRGLVRENSLSGSSVLLEDNSPLLVAATDKDAGPNALIGYRLLNPNEPYF